MTRRYKPLTTSIALLLLGCSFDFGSLLSCSGLSSCSGSSSYDEDRDGTYDGSDCNDNNSSVNPDGVERCNGRDDDCDGRIDEDAVDAEPSYADVDGDGYGDSDATTWACEPPESYVSNKTDCDDQDATAHPNADERCDGVDDDCDGDVDENVADAPQWYQDADGDGYGDPSATTRACASPDGFVANADDCDDTSSGVKPGAVEACANGVDEDCEPATPDDCAYTGVDAGGAAAVLYGRSSDEAAGGALADAGDVDGDGYDDLLVGAAGASTEGAYWVRGPLSGAIGLDLADAHLTGSTAGVAAGTAVAGIGDIDDDGYDDVVIGAPLDTDGTTAGGAAWLYYGPDVASDRAVFWAAAAGERVGASVVGVGDVDGDGGRDVLIGAPGRADGGGAYLITGVPADVVSLADADTVLVGEGSGRAGEAVYAPGDLDADGYDDIALLDPVSGTVWVVTSRPSGTYALSAADVRAIAPGVDDATFASAAFGDLDGDGETDLVLGATFDAERSVDAVAWASFGPLGGAVDLGAADMTVMTGGVYANAGVDVVVGPDLDRDGADDLLLLAGASAALLAPDYTTTIDLPGSAFYGAGPFSRGSWSIAGASSRFGTADLDRVSGAFVGDLDGDGRADVAVGAERDDTNGTNAGAAWILSGPDL